MSAKKSTQDNRGINSSMQFIWKNKPTTRQVDQIVDIIHGVLKFTFLMTIKKTSTREGKF